MDNEQLLNQCKEIVPEKEKAIMFDSVMIVKTSPHTEICRCYGVVLTNDNELKLMDNDCAWHEVLPNQIMADKVLATLLQRLKTMQLQKSFC